MKISVLVLAIIILVVGLTGCDSEQNGASTTKVLTITPVLKVVDTTSPPTTLAITPTANLTPKNTTISPSVSVGSIINDDWQYRWLKGIPCKPPCWEGITPGQTTADEAVKVLEQSPIIYLAKKNPPKGFSRGSVVWDWVDGPQSKDSLGGWGGDALYELKTSSNFIIFIRPQYRETVKLEDVIKSYGEPSHIIALSIVNTDDISKKFYSLWVLYLPLGIALESYNLDKPNFTSQIILKSPIFFAANMSKFEELATVVPGAESMVPWQGFQSFDFYCQIKSCGK